MPVVDTTQSFATGDTVTSTTLNNIMDQSIFVAGAVVSGSGLDITAGGQMTIADNGLPGGKITNGTITSSKIEDGTIVDADINASAGISGSKLADNSTSGVKITDASITAPKLNGAQTGTAPIYGVRAWVNFDATRNSSGGSDSANTNRFIRASGNVTSVLKNAAGDFTINFTTAMPDLNYAVSATTAPLNGRFISLYEGGTLNTGSADAGLTTGSVRIAVHAGTTISTDPDVVTLMVVR